MKIFLRARLLKVAAFLLVLILLVVCTGCPKNQSNSNSAQNKPTIEERAAKAIVAIPGAVRVLFPNADPTTLGVIDTAGAIFKGFLSNPTASAWKKAKDAWDKARAQLLGFNSETLNRIVGAADILISQVIVEDSPAVVAEDAPSTAKSRPAPARITISFKEDDVKKLEELVNVKRE